MADEPVLPSSNPTEEAYSFSLEVPQHIPRAWERAPKPPFANRHGGRKVWKRYETLPRDIDGDAGGESAAGFALGDATNTSYAVKRLRVKGPLENLAEGKENRPSRYLATLTDEAKGTPKRKHVTRSSPKPDSRQAQAQPIDNEIVTENMVAEGMVQEDSLEASQSPAPDEARELLNRDDMSDQTVDNQISKPHHDDSGNIGEVVSDNVGITSLPLAATSIKPERSVSEAETPQPSRGTASGTEPVPELTYPNPISPITPRVGPAAISEAVLPQFVDCPHMRKLETESTGCDEGSSADLESNTGHPEHIVSPRSLDSFSQNAATPVPPSSKKLRHTHKLLDGSSPGGSPQIGTSLLRRESMRKRESPTRKRETRKTRSPKKRDTLSRRDTLQEREILQKVIAETSQNPCSEKIDNKVGNDTTLLSNESQAEDSATSSKPVAGISQSSDDGSAGAENVSKDTGDASVKNDLHRAMEAIEVLQQPVPDQVGQSPSSTLIDALEELKAIDNTNESIAKAEVEEAVQTVEAVTDQTGSPSRTTRSGTRFSDDTSMLRDFLNRAQASKAAKTPVLLPLDAPNPQISPRRSPRKALGSHKGTAATKQQQSGDIANRPGTPPGTSKSDGLEFDDAEEITATPTSCRRSTRTRLPAPPKAPPSAPSFIPVRRADGTDPVVLQKSEAQELAMVTRANTRRNKGQSKPPPLALKELPGDTTELAEARQRAENGKAVGWAETLASYQEAKEKAEAAEEMKPKVRRMRGLGAANGTPAPKKTAKTAGSLDNTPAVKRRGRAM